MTSDDTLSLLKWHAGLVGEPLDLRSVSGSAAAGGDVERAVADLLATLQRLNIELNGPVPSAQAGETVRKVSRDAAYAVAEATRMLRDAAAPGAARSVETAWLAVLAGDIDDVVQHVADEHRDSQ